MTSSYLEWLKIRDAFGESYNFEEREDAALAACKFYELQIKATKDAMLTWSLVGVRLKVVKDVRKMIARLIWDARDEARYALK